MKFIQKLRDLAADLHLPAREDFKHDPLDYTKGSIRLIRILPSLSADKLIQCEISHTSINASYECLSYRWGDANPEHEILLNGKLFRVRQNLFDFLQLLRSRGAETLESSPFLWIDSLCIDQSTTKERNHQVGQMGQIYRSASLVKIWLGKCPRLLESLRERPARYVDWGRTHVSPYQTNGKLSPLLAEIYKSYQGPRFVSGRLTLARHRNRQHGEDFFARNHNQQLDEDLFASSQDHQLEEEFFANEYWNRAWITQEIYVARQAVIVLENEEFSIRSCIDVLWGCHKLTVHTNPIVKKFALFLGFDDSGLPIIQPGGTSDSLIALLRQFADKHCEIPRDRLYSLLSLHRHGEKVVIDYAQPDDELLVQVVECLNEAVGLCSVVNIIRSLMPQSEPLGKGFLEIDIHDLALEWGSVQVFEKESLSRAKAPYTCRTLVAITSNDAENACQLVPKIFEKLRGKATLFETQASKLEDVDFAAYGREAMTLTSLDTHTRRLGRIISPSGNMIGPSTLRMYTNGFDIVDKHDFWTLRIELGLVWSMLGAVDPKELCKNLHRFSYGGICRDVRLGVH